MRILFDQGTPVPLRSLLADHSVSTAYERGWSTLENGELLARAQKEFDVLLTTDGNLRHQQNLTSFDLAIVVLPTTSWPKIRRHPKEVLEALTAARRGQCIDVVFSDDPT